jgi:hypothetical protein
MLNKKLLTVAIVAGSALLTGCGSSSKSNSDVDTTGSTIGTSIESGTFLGDAVNASPLTDASTVVDSCSEFGGTLASAVCTLPSRITATGGSFNKDVTYLLTSMTKLGYGDKELETAADVSWLKDSQNTVSLTIPAGTTIKGQTGSAFVVTRGAELNAEGSASAPVTFESEDSDLVGAAEWGGLVIQGFGISNQCPSTGICNISGEGASGNYGGDDNADSSGSLEYVVVTEGGSVVGVDDELNGVGFMGVGSGTTVDYLQVNDNSDDGVEFWGGAVVAKHLVLTANQDDSIDWDHGWVGGIQYAIVKQTNGAGDHAFETDNDGNSMDNDPRSMPTMANITAISGGADSAIRHKEGTAGLFYNVAVVEQGTAATCIDIDDQATANQIDTGMIYTNVELACQTTVKADDEVSGTDFSQELVDSTTSSINATTDSSVSVDGDYVVTGTTTISSAPTIDNSQITGNTVMGAVENAADNWFEGWTITGSL